MRRTVQVGRRGSAVGVVGLGCMGMSFGYDMAAQRDEKALVDVIRRSIDLGANLIDTADVYGPYTNETLVGRALSGGYRQKTFLATKVGVEAGFASGSAEPVLTMNGRPDHIRRSIDGSLSRLGTDAVDLYQLHRVDPDVPLEETWGAMAEIVAAGKARAIGLSDVSVQQIQQAQEIHEVAAVQSELSLWTRDALDDVLPYCEENAIAFLAYAPLGNGFLTGKFQSVEDIPENDTRRSRPRFQPETIDANLAIVRRISDLASKIESTPAQLALAWVMAQGLNVVPIPGTRSRKYLEQNVGAADIVLDASVLSELNHLQSPTGERR